VVTPLVGETGLIGMAMVSGRVAEVRPFQEEDRTLLETLANHTSVSIEKTRLLGKVQEEVALRTYQALHDDLTGLPNRQQLTERLTTALEAARLRGGRLAVVLLDLEGFKEVNDSLGHQAGDAVLQSLCRRLASAVPPQATMARFGGDEFVLLLPDVRDADDAIRQATPVLDLLNQPISYGELKLAVGARMGVALYPEHGQDGPTLMQRADVAMYDARASYTRHEVYSPERDPFSPQRLALAGRLREGAGRREIEVWYQPIQSLRTGEVVGAEALVRWRHPERGILEPGDFVAFTDRTGLARSLALHVLATAVHQCTAWREAGLDMAVSVNLSVRNLIDPSLAGDVLDLLVASGLPAAQLVLEVTETSIMAESRRSMSTLSQLHEMGVRMAVDDFGTGYSSLSRLRRLPVSELKIDKSFVLNATSDSQDAAIVRSTVELGHRLGLLVVAEGAEDRDTVDWLAEIGCDLVQGYVISRPRPPDKFEQWLTGHDVARLPMPAP
jgi:diguanylate cyclase (GGDEF)-like protein